MNRIKQKGFYLSEPFHWVDWHAGVKFEGDSYYLLKFENDKCFIDSINKKSEINIGYLVSKDNFGSYKIGENIIEINYNPNTEFEVKKIFAIVSSDLLLDDNLKEYRYIEDLDSL